MKNACRTKKQKIRRRGDFASWVLWAATRSKMDAARGFAYDVQVPRPSIHFALNDFWAFKCCGRTNIRSGWSDSRRSARRTALDAEDAAAQVWSTEWSPEDASKEGYEKIAAPPVVKGRKVEDSSIIGGAAFDAGGAMPTPVDGGHGFPEHEYDLEESYHAGSGAMYRCSAVTEDEVFFEWLLGEPKQSRIAETLQVSPPPPAPFPPLPNPHTIRCCATGGQSHCHLPHHGTDFDGSVRGSRAG